MTSKIPQQLTDLADRISRRRIEDHYTQRQAIQTYETIGELLTIVSWLERRVAELERKQPLPQ